MKKIVFVCTNDIYVSKTYFSKFMNGNFPINASVLEETDDLGELIDISDKIYCAWKDSTKEMYYYYTTDNVLDGCINFLYAPFAGLAHSYMYDIINHADNRYCIISLREKYNTQLVPLGLYNILLDSKFTKISFSMITDILDAQSENNLISSDMEMIKEYILTGKVSQLSEIGEEMIPYIETND